MYINIDNNIYIYIYIYINIDNNIYIYIYNNTLRYNNMSSTLVILMRYFSANCGCWLSMNIQAMTS